MKCFNCGTDVNENMLFCGNCGCKLCSQCNVNEKSPKYVTVGYPLGYKVVETGEIVYVMDIGVSHIELPQDLLAVWSEVSAGKDADIEKIEILHNYNCILDINDETDKYRFMSCFPSRQGFGAEKDGKHVVYLGVSSIFLDEPLLNLWRLADCRKNLNQIMFDSKYEPDIFCDLILNLIKAELVYISF